MVAVTVIVMAGRLEVHGIDDKSHVGKLSFIGKLLDSGYIALVYLVAADDVQGNVRQFGKNGRIRQNAVGWRVNDNGIVRSLEGLDKLFNLGPGEQGNGIGNMGASVEDVHPRMIRKGMNDGGKVGNLVEQDGAQALAALAAKLAGEGGLA